MTIDWQAFTLYAAITALLGGFMIGLAAVWLAWANGRIAGISGILGQLIRKLASGGSGSAWRALFLLGLICAPLLWQRFAPLPESKISTSTPALIIAGLLVGIGTRYANGCTSGHGICGLARLSTRSLLAVLTFMASGFLTVYLIRDIF